MINKKLKGITLVETILYIGLFSIIVLLVFNFMLSTQEATLRNNRRGSIYKSAEFVIQHLNYSFDNALTIDPTNSIFGTDEDILEIQFTDGNKQYTLLNNTLLFDSIPITPSEISITTFTLTPIYNDEAEIVAVKILINIVSKKDSNLTDTINILETLR